MHYKDNLSCLLPSRRVFMVGAIKGRVEHLKKLHYHLVSMIKPQEDSIIYGGDSLSGENPQAAVQEICEFRCWFLAHPLWVHDRRVVFLNGMSEEIFTKIFMLHLAPNPLEIIQFMLECNMARLFQRFDVDIEKLLRVCAIINDHHETEGRKILAEWTRALRKAAVQSYGLFDYVHNCRFCCYAPDKSLLMVHSGLDENLPLMKQNDNFWLGGRNFFDHKTQYLGFNKIIRAKDHFGASQSGLSARSVFTDHRISLDDSDGLCCAVLENDGAGNIAIEKIEITL